MLAAPEPTALTEPIGFLNGITTQEHIKRKGWEGSVWKGKFNVTLVQSHAQALRCSLDMDFAMLREQPEDIFHPLLWKHSGHLELSEVRKRYRVIDRKAVRRWLMNVPWNEFRDWYIQAGNAKWNSCEYAEEEWWEKALFVGQRNFCQSSSVIVVRSFLVSVDDYGRRLRITITSDLPMLSQLPTWPLNFLTSNPLNFFPVSPPIH